MALTRRSFLEIAGSAVVYGFSFSCGILDEDSIELPKDWLIEPASRYFENYTQWFVIHPDGSVTAYTGRTELGQGLKTVLGNVISQGFDLPPEKVELVMGDTDLCPDDGPSAGSSSTLKVGWGFWTACHRVRNDLMRRASEALGRPEADLEYRAGIIVDRNDPSTRVGIGELVDGNVRLASIDPDSVHVEIPKYVDKGTPAANGEAIVTGTLTYAGDVFPGECDYGSFLLPKYHVWMTELLSVDLEGARKISGVKTAERSEQSAFVVADSYQTVQRALEAMNAVWAVPKRPREFDNEAEIRTDTKLIQTVEKRGDPQEAFARCAHDLSESYITQYANPAPIETDTAVARADDSGVEVWASTQGPFIARNRIAKRFGISEKTVRVIGMPVGGAFGSKLANPAPDDAARMALESGRTVKHVDSRAAQFNYRGRVKESVLIDIHSGVSSSGELLAQTIDLHQDVGRGTTNVYRVPNIRTRIYKAEMPIRHLTMRGTSYTQTCFALESHMDMLAETVGLDPVEFRKRNLVTSSFANLLDTCAEMIDYDPAQTLEDRGTGFGLCFHAGRQFAAVTAEVSVDRATGVIRVEQMCGAYDIGQVMNINTLTASTKGAMICGLGYALTEEVTIDGHAPLTQSLHSYKVPRFSHVPPIKLAFFDERVGKGKPRGCGEVPVPPTIAAICNAVYRAIGIRFHTLPMTPARVLAALESS